jgi:hypothetical protein
MYPTFGMSSYESQTRHQKLVVCRVNEKNIKYLNNVIKKTLWRHSPRTDYTDGATAAGRRSSANF